MTKKKSLKRVILKVRPERSASRDSHPLTDEASVHSDREEPGTGPIFNLLDYDRPFKNPNYVTPKKFRPLKQIVTSEKASLLGLNVNKSKDKSHQTPKVEFPTIPPVYYWELEPPPPLIPQKKYCDITGLEAPYLDPKTRLRYHSSEVYQVIKTLPLDVPQDYLSVRNAAVILK